MGEPFGRYGYRSWPTIPGISLDETGFRVKGARGDLICFNAPLKTARAVATSPYGQTIGFSINDGGPSKGRFSTTAPGFALYFPAGFRLRLAAIGSPYLSWTDGSAVAGVPAPPATWLLLSFQDRQAPWMLGFPDGPVALKITGRPGNWILEAPTTFKGWVRFGLPVGAQAVDANSAASLGELIQQAQKVAPLFSQMAPDLQRVSVTADPGGVTGIWEFNRPGAVVPLPVRMAPIVGDRIKCLSTVLPTEILTEEGPVDVLEGNTLTVRFPAQGIPRGRAVALGAPVDSAPASVGFTDPGSVAELALRIRLAGTDAETMKLAEQTASAYLGQLMLGTEPNSNQPMPFAADGSDLDLVASHGLLAEALSANAETGGALNSLLTSLSWRMDWFHWRIIDADPAKARCAGALASVAGMFASDPESRLIGAMWESGLAGERGLDRWRRRRMEFQEEPLRPDPLLELRHRAYGYLPGPSADSKFLPLLQSPFRVFGEFSVQAGVQDARLFAAWSSSDLRLAGFASNLAGNWVAKTNLTSLGVMTRAPFTDVSFAPESPGALEAWIDPTTPIQIPKSAPVPVYDPKPIRLDPR